MSEIVSCFDKKVRETFKESIVSRYNELRAKNVNIISAMLATLTENNVDVQTAKEVALVLIQYCLETASKK